MCLFASFATHSFYSQIKHKSPIIWKESHNLKQRYISLLTNYQSPNHQQITSLWSALCLFSYQTPLTPTCSFFSCVLFPSFLLLVWCYLRNQHFRVFEIQKKQYQSFPQQLVHQWWHPPACDIRGTIFCFFRGGHWAATTINDLELFILLLLLLSIPFWCTVNIPCGSNPWWLAWSSCQGKCSNRKHSWLWQWWSFLENSINIWERIKN